MADDIVLISTDALTAQFARIDAEAEAQLAKMSERALEGMRQKEREEGELQADRNQQEIEMRLQEIRETEIARLRAQLSAEYAAKLDRAIAEVEERSKASIERLKNEIAMERAQLLEGQAALERERHRQNAQHLSEFERMRQLRESWLREHDDSMSAIRAAERQLAEERASLSIAAATLDQLRNEAQLEAGHSYQQARQQLDEDRAQAMALLQRERAALGVERTEYQQRMRVMAEQGRLVEELRAQVLSLTQARADAETQAAQAEAELSRMRERLRSVEQDRNSLEKDQSITALAQTNAARRLQTSLTLAERRTAEALQAAEQHARENQRLRGLLRMALESLQPGDIQEADREQIEAFLRTDSPDPNVTLQWTQAMTPSMRVSQLATPQTGTDSTSLMAALMTQMSCLQAQVAQMQSKGPSIPPYPQTSSAIALAKSGNFGEKSSLDGSLPTPPTINVVGPSGAPIETPQSAAEQWTVHEMRYTQPPGAATQGSVVAPQSVASGPASQVSAAPASASLRIPSVTITPAPPPTVPPPAAPPARATQATTNLSASTARSAAPVRAMGRRASAPLTQPPPEPVTQAPPQHRLSLVPLGQDPRIAQPASVAPAPTQDVPLPTSPTGSFITEVPDEALSFIGTPSIH